MVSSLHDRTYGCQACATDVELPDLREDDRFADYQLREWTCPGCRMHAHGRPSRGHGGVSGIPLWLGEQLWGTTCLHDDLALLDHLFAITRAALASAAADELASDLVEAHARATLSRIAHGLSAPIVPPHPGLDGIVMRWHPFVERARAQEVVVTFRVRPPTPAGMFAFEYRAPDARDTLRLHTCYTVWRALPAGVDP